jgi:hypothetical protein
MMASNKNFMLPGITPDMKQKIEESQKRDTMPADLTQATNDQLELSLKSYNEMLCSPLDFGTAPMRVLKLKNAVKKEMMRRGMEVPID